MRRTALISVAAALAVVIGSMWWILRAVRDLEAGEQQARARAAHEERVRLALWHMDSSLTTVLAFENGLPLDLSTEHRASQPTFVARRFELTPEGASAQDAQPSVEALLAALTQPPLAPGPPPPAPRERLLVPPPAVPPPADRSHASPETTRAERMSASPSEAQPRSQDLSEERDPWAVVKETSGVLSDRIAVLPNHIDFDRRNELSGQQAVFLNVDPGDLGPRDEPGSSEPKSTDEPTEKAGAKSERTREDSSAADGPGPPIVRQDLRTPTTPPGPTGVVRTLEPVWLDGRLFLVRRIARSGREALQAVELDDGAMRAWLLELVGDQFVNAWLVPATGEDDPGRRLAMLPYRLIPGGAATPADEVVAPSARLGVLLALGSLLFVGLGTVAIVLAAMRAARQRSAFASAVIHELRTPLTTFRLYTDMLAEGVVPASERSGYVETLRREGDRLGHLVENVLAFARLEPRQGLRTAPLVLAPVVRDISDRLTERARRAGATFELDIAAEAEDVWVKAEPVTVERIFGNLCDNSCRYAGENPQLGLSVVVRGRRLILVWRDDGPGLPPGAKRKLERRGSWGPSPANDGGGPQGTEGIGLGLALCRQLAAGLGAKLRAVDTEHGAAIELSLPIVSPP